MVNAMNPSRGNSTNTGSPIERKIKLGLFEWIRFQCLSVLFEFILSFQMRDASWKEPLFASLGSNPHCRILSFGRGALATARALAVRQPGGSVIALDSNPRPIKRVFRRLVQNQMPNVTTVEESESESLPFEVGFFDKVVLVLAFHSRVPEKKLCIAKEMLRVLRHGGMLHIAAYDKPSLPEERSLLAISRYLSGATAADPHLDGSWIKILTKAGFAGIRRQASCSVVGGRISVVRARKP